VQVSAGDHRIEVDWGPTPAVWLGRAAFALGWLVILWLVWTSRTVHFRKLTAAWVLAAGVVLTAAGGLAAHDARPSSIRADFGAVQLLGSSVEVAPGGSTAVVRLHWSVSMHTEPLTAFVHVLDEQGGVVAQNDGPLGGAYFPSSRWTPGLLFSQDHLIEIPDGMAPGRYRLLAGLYHPGQADAPLVAADHDEPRVDAGVLEVGH